MTVCAIPALTWKRMTLHDDEACLATIGLFSTTMPAPDVAVKPAVLPLCPPNRTREGPLPVSQALPSVPSTP